MEVRYADKATTCDYEGDGCFTADMLFAGLERLTKPILVSWILSA